MTGYLVKTALCCRRAPPQPPGADARTSVRRKGAKPAAAPKRDFRTGHFESKSGHLPCFRVEIVGVGCGSLEKMVTFAEKKSGMEQHETDEKFMRLALNEARKALKQQEVPIGAVVVADGAVIGRGHNLVETLADPTAHAEMQALTAAAATLGGKYLQECTLYVTVEPCIMCAGAIGWAQVSRVVWGADDPKKGFRCYSEAVFHPRTTVARGVLREECEELMRVFFAGLRG